MLHARLRHQNFNWLAMMEVRPTEQELGERERCSGWEVSLRLGETLTFLGQLEVTHWQYNRMESDFQDENRDADAIQ